MSHALLARAAEGLKPSRAAYLVTVGIWLSSHKIRTGLATYSRLRISGRVMVIEYDLTRFSNILEPAGLAIYSKLRIRARGRVRVNLESFG